MAQSFWLINSNRSEVRRFIKNTANKDTFFEYMFVDSGKIVGVLGKEPPVKTKREELKIDNARTTMTAAEDTIALSGSSGTIDYTTTARLR